MSFYTSTLDAADDFDLDPTPRAIARFARKHDNCTAHVTRTGSVLLIDRADGHVKLVKTMRAACEWLGY